MSFQVVVCLCLLLPDAAFFPVDAVELLAGRPGDNPVEVLTHEGDVMGQLLGTGREFQRQLLLDGRVVFM